MVAKHYIGLIAKNRRGKDSVGHLIAEFVAPETVTVIRFSDSLNELLDRLNATLNPGGIEVPRTRDVQQTLSTGVRDLYGQDVLARAVHLRAQRIESDWVVINGIRRPADTELLRTLPGFRLVYVDAPPELAYEWMKRANERAGDAGKTYEQFLAEDNAEPERLIEEIGRQRDWTVVNDEDDPEKTKFRDQVRLMLTGLFGR